MKNKFLISLALIAAVMVANAQNETSPIRWKDYTPNGFCGNWEISASAGANGFLRFGDNKNPDFGDLIGFSYSVSVAKWFNPIVGSRISWQGSSASILNNGNLRDFDFIFLHYDQLWNLTNWICGYKENRFYNAVLTTGMGYSENTTSNNRDFAVALGLQNRFRICDAWNIDVELQSIVTKASFGGPKAPTSGWSCLALDVSAHVGVTYKIPTRNWSTTPQSKKQDDGCMKRVGDLEKDNGNYKRALKDAEERNDQLKKELGKARQSSQAQESKPSTEYSPKETQVSFAIFFAGDDSALTDEAKTSINAIIEVMKKEGSNATYSIVGYSDRDTGTPNGNMELSKKRAESVRKALVNGGIDASKLRAEGRGDTLQPLGSGTINRCVIILQDK